MTEFVVVMVIVIEERNQRVEGGDAGTREPLCAKLLRV